VWEVPEDGAYGDTDTNTLRIRVRPDLPLDLVRETLLHEVLHAVYRTAGVDSTIMREEQIVCAISPHLMDALRRSPGLAEYLLAPGALQSSKAKKGST
jgi:hypothetical protein